MLKEVVSYTDYNDAPQQETLYFNLTRTEMMDMLDLQPRLEAWRASTSGPQRDMTSEEIKELLEIVKFLIEKSYGIRSADGKQFQKSPEIFAAFQQTAVYDEFTFNLFQFPERAISFMIGILPKGIDTPELREAVKDAEDVGAQLAAARGTHEISLPPDSELPSSDDPPWIRENREPTSSEMQTMSKEELQQLYRRKTQQ